MKIIFKDWEDCFDMGDLHPKMRPVLEFVMNQADQLGVSLVITSVKRDDGVHKALRGLDLVPEDRDIEVMEKIREKTNDRWDYGKSPYSVVPPIRHGTAPHIHLQVRSETVERPSDVDDS